MRLVFTLKHIFPLRIEEQLRVRLVCMLEDSEPQHGRYPVPTTSSSMPIATPRTLNTHICFWDRHPFNSSVIRIPIRMIHPQKAFTLVKSSSYTMPVNLSTLENTQTPQYIWDGVFCSESCCLAFIYENLHNPLYTYALPLMYYVYGNKRNIALSWRRLDTYGGNLNIDAFRTMYTQSLVNYHPVPDMVAN